MGCSNSKAGGAGRERVQRAGGSSTEESAAGNQQQNETWEVTDMGCSSSKAGGAPSSSKRSPKKSGIASLELQIPVRAGSNCASARRHGTAPAAAHGLGSLPGSSAPSPRSALGPPPRSANTRGALEQRRHSVTQHRIGPAIEPLVRVRVRG